MVEVENGLLGVKRFILMRLIELMTFKSDSLIPNLIGMSGESVCWINHFHFTIARTFVERHLIPSKKERGKEIRVHLQNKQGCIFMVYVGICTPKQVNDVMVNCLGWYKDFGGSFGFNSYHSWVRCSGNYSRYLKERGIKERKEEEITTVVNNKNVDNKEKEKQGKMNIIRNKKRVRHTIVNIPKDGVHFGFSCYDRSSVILSIISLVHISILPPLFNDGLRCIAYDVLGRFEDDSFHHQDEEGKKVSNIREYYYN